MYHAVCCTVWHGVWRAVEVGVSLWCVLALVCAGSGVCWPSDTSRQTEAVSLEDDAPKTDVPVPSWAIKKAEKTAETKKKEEKAAKKAAKAYVGWVRVCTWLGPAV